MTSPGPLRADATDIDAWANRKPPEWLLPVLVRRLILASGVRLKQVSFAAGEGVQLGGWDGLVSAEGGDAFVPEGLSGWELGKDKKVKAKADREYEKRCKDSGEVDSEKATFVFVTPRRWGGKESWVKRRREENVFRDVKVYDADNLETWLEQAPGVHLWFSRLVGKSPRDAADLDSFWQEWSRATIPDTSPWLVVAGRGEQEEKLATWLGNADAGTFGARAESPEDSLAFLAATMRRMTAEDFERQISRCVLVDDPATWRELVESKRPLLLVPRFDVEGMFAGAVSRGHQVFVPLGTDHAGVGGTVDLPRLGREAAREALREMGVEDHGQADELAGLARRSPTAMRREIARYPGFREPEWARLPSARDVVPAFFAGVWDDGNGADRAAVAKLAGRGYDEVRSSLERWADGPDVPARLSSGRWILTSKEDAWRLLGRRVSEEDLRRFEDVAIEVLGRRDPSYDLPKGQRWAAGVYSATRPESGLLRKGLADALAIMGARGGKPLAGGATGRERAEAIVSRLLRAAGNDWVSWASLSSVMPLLAEAAPRSFLRAVEAGLVGEVPVLARLFTDSRESGSDHSPHTELLWALERLAGSRDHLQRASLALAALARLDPGGRLANRPIGSLASLFSLQAPSTEADLKERMWVVDRIREHEPKVAWVLLLSIVPGIGGGLVFPGNAPRYREWATKPAAQP